MEKNDDIFKEIKLIENVQRRMKMNQYCKKFMYRILAFMLTFMNVIILWDKLVSGK